MGFTSDPILLYFFTQFVSIKYDQIRDSIDLLIKDGDKFDIDTVLLNSEIKELNIFNKDITDFAFKLRNFHHYTEVEKYELLLDELKKDESIDFVELYKLVTNSEDWLEYKIMLFRMKNELHILVKFLRKNIGIRY